MGNNQNDLLSMSQHAGASKLGYGPNYSGPARTLGGMNGVSALKSPTAGSRYPKVTNKKMGL